MNIVMTQAGIYELYCKMINFPIYKSQHEGDVSQFMLHCEEIFFEQKLERVCVHFTGGFSRDLINKPKLWQFASKDMETVEGVDVVQMVENLFAGLLAGTIRKLMEDSYCNMLVAKSDLKEFQRIRRAVQYYAQSNWRCAFTRHDLNKAVNDCVISRYIKRVAVHGGCVDVELNGAGHELLSALPVNAAHWLAPTAKPVAEYDHNG